MQSGRFTFAEATTIRDTIDQLDALWDFDARRGLVDARGSAQYEDSPAARLRAMLEDAEVEAPQEF
jgi:hypothetical protein